MVSFILELDAKQDKKIKQLMLDENISSKPKAVIRIVEEYEG